MTEVLAPAGSPEAVTAAVRAGADAVYFGAPDFNARRNAVNFTFDDIREAARYCGIRGVKTYLTLNTLVTDEELGGALKTAWRAAEAGVDAFIVQDPGLAALIAKHLPGIPLHASTQMSVHSADALELLKDMGFSRVVPAREMDRDSLAGLCASAKRLGLEVEVFVHGALCMCLSGQCYLSSILGGRSGNRGLCAQPCRLEFSAPRGTGHDLSLKDLSLLDHVNDLVAMGVDSFKIEGRMKRAEYTAAASAVFSAAVRGERVPEGAAQVLSGIFSRSGHTDGYYVGKTGRDMFGTRTAEDERMTAKTLSSAHELYRRERQRVALTGRLCLNAGRPLRLTVTDENGNTASVCGGVPQRAVNAKTGPEFLKQKLEKCGGTCYYFKELECIADEGLAVSGAEIGELRRRAFAKLDDARDPAARGAEYAEPDYAPYRRVMPEKAAKIKPDGEKIAAQFRSPDQIPDGVAGVSAVILPAECGFDGLKLPDGVEVIADIPRGIIRRGDEIVGCLKRARERGVRAAMCGNLAAFDYARRAGLIPLAGFGMNIYNTESLREMERLGAAAAVLSFELPAAGISALGGGIPKGVITYGRLPLMIFKNCPGKFAGCGGCPGKCSVTDRKGIEFPVMCRGEFAELFNSRPLWMLDRTKELKGTDFELLMFTDEDRRRCGEVIAAAASGAAPQGLYTRGLYHREVY